MLPDGPTELHYVGDILSWDFPRSALALPKVRDFNLNSTAVQLGDIATRTISDSIPATGHF